jgi:hypothetical protein
MRRLLALLIVFIVGGAGALVWLRVRDSSTATAEPGSQVAAPIIEKKPPVVATRRFNPASPPSDMPALQPDEAAVTDSNFISAAVVRGETRKTGGGTAVVTITQVKITLQLSVTIWVPEDATQKVLDHEEGHRQISEFYYSSADQVATRVAASYIGKQIAISGSDLDAEASTALQQASDEITAEYNRQLGPEAAQLRYDAITDHARNDVLAKDAVSQVLPAR